MRSPNLIALDLNGTLLATKEGTGGALTERTKAILEKISEQEIEIVVASGRAYGALPLAMYGMRKSGENGWEGCLG